MHCLDTAKGFIKVFNPQHDLFFHKNETGYATLPHPI
jgi:hypothetical protein